MDKPNMTSVRQDIQINGSGGGTWTPDTRIMIPMTQTKNYHKRNGLERTFLSGHTFRHTLANVLIEHYTL